MLSKIGEHNTTQLFLKSIEVLQITFLIFKNLNIFFFNSRRKNIHDSISEATMAFEIFLRETFINKTGH